MVGRNWGEHLPLRNPLCQIFIRKWQKESFTIGISFERCCQMLHTWLQSEGSAATVRVLMTKLTMCGFGDTVIELAEHLLDSDIDN